jgi:hypothetical protein
MIYLSPFMESEGSQQPATDSYSNLNECNQLLQTQFIQDPF